MGGGREKDASAVPENGEKTRKSPSNGENGNGRRSPDRSLDLVRPPDGGWGWMVVLGSFMIHVIADGIVYSFGIFYMEFLHYYKGGKGETAWVGSLVPGVTLTVGPLASIITNKYGCRATTMVGAVIAASGFVLSLFAPNLYFLYFSFGILSGFGFGLIYLPAIVIVGYYFEERRAFATGLAVCGSGLGAFIFNPLSKFLIDTYGWRGAILIEAGIILNCVLCGALFRPLTGPKMSETNSEDCDKNAPKSDNSNYKGRDMRLVKDALEMEFLITSNGIPNGDGDTKSEQITLTDNQITSTPSSPKKGAPSFFQDQNNSTALFRSEGSLHRAGNGTRTLPISPLARDQSNKPHQMKRLLSVDNHPTSPRRRQLTPGSLYQSGSLLNVSLHRSHPAMYIASLTSIPNLDAEDSETKKLCGVEIPTGVYYSLKQMLDLSLLKDVIFLLFVISNFFTSIGFNMPFIFLTDRAVDEGTAEEDAKWLVSAIGISNTIGRVLFGFLADKKGVNRLMLYCSALTICGIATALCPLCTTFPLLLLYACVFGLFIGVYVSLTSVVLVDLLGLEMLTNSFGLLLMFQGFATLIGPPIAGWLYDGTGSYDVSFIVAGVVVAFSGFMLFFIPLVRRCVYNKKVREQREQDAEVEVTLSIDAV